MTQDAREKGADRRRKKRIEEMMGGRVEVGVGNRDVGGIVEMGRVVKRKLIFVHHLMNLPEDSLAHECAIIQERLSFPGLISEMKYFLKGLDLPDMREVSKDQWKTHVNKLIREKNKHDLVKMAER